MTGELSIIESLTPEVIAEGVGVLQQVQSFLAQNGEIVMLIIGTMINHMIKPLVKNSLLIPFITFFICIGVFYLLNDSRTIKSLIFGGLYLWVLVTLQYLQDKKAVENKLLQQQKSGA